MKLDFGLNLHQEQKLVMTHELQLSVKLLQMSTYELFEYVEAQVMENPLLEFEDKSEKNENSELNNDEKSQEELREYDEIDFHIDNAGYDEGYYYDSKEETSPLNFISKEMNLWDLLKEQLTFSPLNQGQYLIGLYMIDNIDENGYLKIDIEEIVTALRCSYEAANELLQLIQSFEPVGVGARSVGECLKLQLYYSGITDEILYNIVDKMLVEVGEGKLSRIAKENNISESLAREYINIIKNLNPKPGLRFYTDAVKYIIPDVYIGKDEEELIVVVNEEGIPQLNINKTYRDLLKNKDSNEYKYVRERLQGAIWMIKSIEQRISTIKKVVEAIVDYQRDFFEGDGELKPLTLKQIAARIDMHESTVSRAVNGKYAQTPRGIFELKTFFMRGIQNSTGEDISTTRIKNSIKELIGQENSSAPYSDARLCEMLNAIGMNISRRTVAKYREELNMPPSSKRKK